jgi:hypothetical protein
MKDRGVACDLTDYVDFGLGAAVAGGAALGWTTVVEVLLVVDVGAVVQGCHANSTMSAAITTTATMPKMVAPLFVSRTSGV